LSKDSVYRASFLQVVHFFRHGRAIARVARTDMVIPEIPLLVGAKMLNGL
jgi:hypothetical protein